MSKYIEKETETNQPINHNEKRLFSAKIAGNSFEYASNGQRNSSCLIAKLVVVCTTANITKPLLILNQHSTEKDVSTGQQKIIQNRQTTA